METVEDAKKMYENINRDILECKFQLAYKV